MLKKQLKAISKLKDAPYFARIDIREGEEPIEEIYIGIASFMSDDDQFGV